MQLIKHRCNQIKDLQDLSPEYGVEIDLRSSVSVSGKMHLSHDPWAEGEDFGKWLAAYKAKGLSGPLILNTKEDGLEFKALEQLDKLQIKNYFFLDTALPTLVKWTVKNDQKHFAVRWSKYEPLEFCEKFKDLCDWVWVDCFFLEIPPAAVIEKLKTSFKVCLVSPELQGGDVKLISEFRNKIGKVDAVCSKRPDLWSATT